jgi:hypothetical protein
MLKKILMLFLILAASLVILSGCENPLSDLTMIGWGNIDSSGSIRGSSGNFTVDHPSTGNYNINWTDGTITSNTNTLVQATMVSGFNENIVWQGFGDGIGFNIYDADSGAAVNRGFTFVAYQW